MSNVYRVDYTKVVKGNVGTSPVGGNSSGAGEQHVASVASAFCSAETPQLAAAIVAAYASASIEININNITEVATDVQVAS